VVESDRSTTDQPRGLLFTAFEPSGDDHASAVIGELRRRHPALPIFAWGGPKMERAGATIIERTGDDAVMGVPGISKIIQHQRINQRIDAWLAEHRVDAHVPVDSPAANMPICEIAKRHGTRVVHLVAPQIWAWGRWRIHRLRRLTDLVLCMLHFEPAFFERRRVPARFIGHFLFDQMPDPAMLDRRAATFGDGSPRIAMMPGSRPDELERHLPVILDAFRALKKLHPGAVGVMAATSDRVADLLKRLAERRGGVPEDVRFVVQDTDAVIRWCEIALVKSGTVTLQVARQRRPMVVFYKKSNPLFYLLARSVLATSVFSLPNVLARRRIVPEFIPLFAGAGPVVKAAHTLLTDSAARERQLTDLDRVIETFRGANAARLAADAIEEVIGLRDATPAVSGMGGSGGTAHPPTAQASRGTPVPT
jgi:lipid-A-disaccharide synthase